MTDTREREIAEKIEREVRALEAQGTSKSASGYGPPFGPPWFIIDTSKADYEVNWPGELIAEAQDNPGEALVKARTDAIETALTAYGREQRARGFREGAEAAAAHVDNVGGALATESFVAFLRDQDLARSALAHAAELLSSVAVAIRALPTPPLPTPPDGESGEAT